MDYAKQEIEFGHRFGGEIRAVEDQGQDIVLRGIAAVFNQWTDLGPFRERIAPGAFKAALPTSDVRLLVNHTGLPLARTSSGTMDLKETRNGLELTARLARKDPDVQALLPKIERGDLSQFSFAFDVGSAGQKWEGEDRTLTSFSELYDVSLVTFPAYDATRVVALRTLQRCRLDRGLDDVQASRLREAIWKGYQL